MSELEKYHDKRNFSETPEPSGEKPCEGSGNRFVIQRHIARREHYDFRMEIGNVLVSWAIPKIPVFDSDEKRLAIKTEDHPPEYFHFEGNIPKGNYGAGSVMVWDYGYYYTQNDYQKISESRAKEMIAAGTIKIYLIGMKLKGNYNLVKIKKSEKDEWLFMKGKEAQRDDYEQRSALTGRNMVEIATGKNNPETGQEKPVEDEKPVDEQSFAVKSEFPSYISPMLATPVDRAFSDSEWLYEMKLDGYRIITTRYKDTTKLFSRNGNDFNSKYPVIARDLSEIKADFVADGEVCYMQNGKPNFQKLQNDESDHENIHYYVFDILWVNGHDLRDVPLTKRKAILKQLLANAPDHIHYLDHIEQKGEEFFEKIQQKKMEGIIAKKKNSNYYSNYRSGEWLKIKTSLRQEMIIAGYIKSGKSGRDLRSILCAVKQGNEYVYTGKVGTGFNGQLQREIIDKLEKIIIE